MWFRAMYLAIGLTTCVVYFCIVWDKMSFGLFLLGCLLADFFLSLTINPRLLHQIFSAVRSRFHIEDDNQEN